MGSLTNLYISESYQSLIHLGTNNTASATFIELEDGLGNGLGVSVNINGDISASGNIYALNLTGSTVDTSSLVTTASFNAYTASQDQKNLTLQSVTQSLENADTLFTNKFTNIGSQSGSWDNTSLNSYTASNDTKWNNIEAQSGSWITESETGSFAQASVFNAYTQSNDQKWNNIELQSGSWVTESETGSFARTDITNTFTATQNINGDLNVQGTLNVTNIHTTTETSSVIYSSGSNQFGDAADDVQTLYGSVRVVNELTASGLNYPTVDNGEESFMQTDGNGNLSLQYVKTIYQNIRNREIFDITKGTPLFVSGSTGDNADVYVADAGNPLRMPATLIAGDATLAAGATGKGIILGHIEGVDTNAYPAGTEVYVAVGGGWTDVKPTGSTIPVQPLGVVTRQSNNGMGIVLTQVPFDLPNLATGNLWVGNENNQATLVPTASFVSSTLTGSFATTGSNLFRGIQTLEDPALNITALVPTSGSLMLVARSFNSSSAHFTASSTAFTNLIFKNSNTAVDTVISGSANIFMNFPSVTAGFKRFMTTGNVALSNGSMQISASMAFPVTASGNYFANVNTTLRGPISSSSWNLSNNDMLGSINIGGPQATSHAERAVSGVSFLQNFQNGVFNFVANRTNLENAVTFRTSYFGGNITVNASSSSFFTEQNIVAGTLTLNNSAFVAGLPAGNAVQIIGSSFTGIGNTLNFSGSTTNLNQGSHFNKQLQASAMIGAQNIFSLERTNVSSSVGMVGVVALGSGLTVTGSNDMTASSVNSNQGAVFVGRWNSLVGTQANSGETVFAVGTGTSSARRTGFLIDSGSNTFVSGTLNVNGPTSFTGSVAGNVVSATVASNTASIDFNAGNYFEVTASVSPLHLNITNIQPGETSTLIISASASSSITFSPNVAQPSGSAYSGSLGSIDILSLVAFNTSKVNVVSTKNMI